MGKKSKTKKMNDNKLDLVKETLENGLTYEGGIKDGEWHGQGILISHPDGFHYEGKFKNGVPHGYGAVSIRDNHRYEGQFKNGVKDGKGILISPDGDEYEGQFKNDILNGRGIYKWSDGRTHEGQFIDGLPHGKRKYTMPDGRYFEGDFKKGKQTQKGKYFWKDGTEYIEEEKKSGITITKEMFTEHAENEEAIELTDKEREELLKEMIGIETDTEEKWICGMCKREQSPKKKQHLFLQHGILCSSCFDKAI